MFTVVINGRFIECPSLDFAIAIAAINKARDLDVEVYEAKPMNGGKVMGLCSYDLNKTSFNNFVEAAKSVVRDLEEGVYLNSAQRLNQQEDDYVPTEEKRPTYMKALDAAIVKWLDKPEYLTELFIIRENLEEESEWFDGIIDQIFYAYPQVVDELKVILKRDHGYRADNYDEEELFWNAPKKLNEQDSIEGQKPLFHCVSQAVYSALSEEDLETVCKEAAEYFSDSLRRALENNDVIPYEFDDDNPEEKIDMSDEEFVAAARKTAKEYSSEDLF